MQVVKPGQISLTTRPFTFRKRHGMSISAMLHVPFDQGEQGRLWGEQSMWNFLAGETESPLIDEGIAKLTPEFLVHGHVYPPGDGSHARAVRARLGGKEKILLVFGDRHWAGNTPTTPQAFDKLPLSWRRAFGGTGFMANPCGIGAQELDGVHRLPNIESPNDRLVSPRQQTEPAGFSALDSQHPARAALRGTYDDSYLREHAPGFAPDIDWRHFNVAPSDQWLETPLAGDEEFCLEGMHPAKERIDGKLPGLRARTFARKQPIDGSENEFLEVPLRLTTVWFFPHAERAILIFQGITSVREIDGTDIVELLAAVERIGSEKDDAHYLDVLKKRADPQMGAIHALNDADLLPEDLDHSDPESEATQAVLAGDGMRAEVERRRSSIDFELARAELRKLGKDPDEMGLRMPAEEPVPTGAKLAGYVERKLVEAREQQLAALEDMLSLLERALELEKTKGIPIFSGGHRGPPLYNATQHLGELRQMFAATGKPFDEAAIFPNLLRKQDAERQGYLQSAHMQSPAARMNGEDAQRLRVEMVRAHTLGLRNFMLHDFTGANFSDMDLSGVDFSGAHLESADFSHCNLSGSNFSRAVLAHAKLDGAIAIDASFREANLGRAGLLGTVLDRADLQGAILSHCRFERTHLRGARLKGALWMDTVWNATDGREAYAEGQTFYKMDLRSLRLEEADLRGCSFIECDLSNARIGGARLDGSSFIDCNLEGAQLVSAQATSASFVSTTRMGGINLARAVLRDANLSDMNLEGASLVRSDLRGANLSGALLTGCDGRASDARGALMTRSVLRGGNWQSANLRDCILQNADLRNTDLRDSNLFGADLSSILIDGSVQLQGALLTRAKTWPRRKAAETGGGQ
ncbi:DUF2169 domain-containing protein [Variovorax sp.]|jgi:uncharacterized protein YjbI with pentapeptide repeats|uniref:DUF2169 domain-containing protein n=1 Tax=Variovorax sp. TaxID=1871043 RepID=UPI0037D9BB1F